MIHSHRTIRSSVRTRQVTKARDLAELSVARSLARKMLAGLSPQMHRSMAIDTAINNRVRNAKFTTALIWAVTYLDMVEEDDLPANRQEASVVADAITNYMEQRTCASTT